MADIQGTINGETIDGTELADTVNAGDGNDTVNGLGGNDTLNGEGGDDTVNGGDGHDILRGNAGNDVLNGDAGDDILIGGGGNDILNGGSGADRISLYTEANGITVDLRLDGVAQDFGALGVDTLFSIEHVFATYWNDTIYGTNAANWIFAAAGTDYVSTFSGDDYVTLGYGNKVVEGGDGNDTVEITDDAFQPLYNADGITVSLELQGQAQATGVGNWTLSGIENLSGDWGSDEFTGDGNANIIAGAGGDDTLTGGGGNDTLMGDGAMVIGTPFTYGTWGFVADLVAIGFGVTEGNDKLYGGAGNDTLYGGGGNDQLRGEADNDTVFGGNGDDFLVGGAGDDILDGGAGADRISLFDPWGENGVTVDLRLEGVGQNFGIFGTDTLSGIEHVTATYGNDLLTGNESANWFWTFGGFDILTGNGGDDVFTVGDQDKVIDGGAGSDTVEIDDNDAFTPAYTAAGIIVSLVLQGGAQATGISNWTLNGIENLSGNWGADHFIGDDNNNTLAGAGGNDVLEGGGGDDALMGDGMILTGLGPNPGNLAFYQSVNGLGDIVVAEGDDTLTGGAGNDTLYGGGGNDLLDGGTGVDTLIGGAGNDVYVVDEYGDILIENANEGVDEIRTSLDYGIGGFVNFENVTALGSGNTFVGGNNAGNILTGNGGNNYFVGEGGNDTILGGAGNDIASFQLPVGTAGMPTLMFGTGADAGKLLVSMVDGASVQTYLKITLNSDGTVTVEGVGIGSFLGTDTLTSIEQIHTFVQTGDNSPATQFLAINLAAQQFGEFVGGSEFAETLNVADFAGAKNANGGGGDDAINGTDIANNLQGGAGNDTLNGAAGNDYLEGQDGNDVINGGADDDYMIGGAGNDTIDGGTGAFDVAVFRLPTGTPGTLRTVAGTGANLGFIIVERVDGATVEQIFRVSVATTGVATVQGLNSAAWMGTDTVANWDELQFLVDNNPFNPNQFTNIAPAKIGTSGNDTINGVFQSEFVFGLDGEDILRGAGNGDVIYGGNGWDRILGQAGDDVLFGEANDDQLTGGLGNDTLYGGAGLDTANFGDGGLNGITIDLNLDGVAQNVGSLGVDTLYSIESVYTAGGNDVITGTDGNNVFSTGAGDDIVNARGGEDYLMAWAGNKIVDGGTGIDTLEFLGSDTPNQNVTLSLLLQGQAQDTGQGIWTVSNFENLSGQGGNDTLIGDNNANVLAGVGGDDVLYGNGGNDILAGDGAYIVGNDPANRGTFAFFSDLGTTNFGDPAGNDTLYGGAGNDTLYGNGGKDVLDGGTGVDKLYGGVGNDILVVQDAVNSTEVYDGGADSDTLEVRAVDAFGPITNYGLTGVTLTSIETLKFASTLTTGAGAILTMAQVSNSGLTALTGGDGLDRLTLVAVGSGTFTIPTFTLNNWQPSGDTTVPGDVIILVGSGNGNFTLNASEALGTVQALIGGNGNDTLNGWSGTDSLNGGLGNNVLNGNGGDDVLILVNQITAQGIPTFLTGFGSAFNGGDGRDVLSIGGVVNFQGTLTGVEGFYLQSAVVSTGVNGQGGQEAAYLEIGLDILELMGSFFVNGTGVIDPDLNPGDSFDFSDVQFEDGSNVTFYFDGEDDGSLTPVTWVGTSHGDVFEPGGARAMITGGGGSDIYEVDFDDDGSYLVITDFTPGEDKLDLTETGFNSLERLADFVEQVGNDVVIHGEDDGASITYVLQNVSIEDLNPEDFILADWTEQVINVGGELTDVIFGFSGNDQVHAAGGDDRIYGGGGTDKLYGEAGDDTLIVEGPITAPGSVFDGGGGFDTIELLPPTGGTAQPFTVINLAGSTLTGIEAVSFGSNFGATVIGVVSLAQAGSIAQLTGSEGVDQLTILVPITSGTYTMPAFSLTDWGANDIIYLSAGSQNGTYTLNAAEGLAARQSLIGGTGNDVLIGSSGVDVLEGGGGVNVLNGNDGDDVLQIINGNPPFIGGAATTFTGAGSTYNGGAGTDTFAAGGVVDFLGTVSSIEAINLLPNVGLAGNPGYRTVANLTLHGDLLGGFASSLALSGNGTITVDLDPGETVNTTAWSIAGGSNLTLKILGSSQDDVITLGSLAQTVIDDGGIDTAVFAGASTSYAVSGTPGALTIGSASLTGIELFQFSNGTFFWNGTSFVSAVSEGLVADGYIEGAQVYIDANNNGVLDSNEPFALTDANGDFTLISPYAGPIRAVGGTNTDTGLPNTVTLSAPDGASVINPLTTLVQSLVESGTSPDAAAAEIAVKAAFGIDPSVTLATLDLIAAANGDPSDPAAQAALQAQKAAASVAQVLTVVNNVGGDTSAALTQLSTVVAAGSPVDLTDTSTLTNIVSSSVSSGTPASTTDIVAVVQSTTQAIVSAQSLSQVTAAQQNFAPTAAVDAYSLFENATSAGAGRVEGVLGNDSDPDGAETALLRVVEARGTGVIPTTVSTTGAASVAGAYGSLSISADGSYSYVANTSAADALAAGVTANDVFTYSIVDPAGQKVSSTITFTVTGTDDLAVAVADTASVAENAIVTGTILVNDYDVDSASIVVAQVNGSAANVGSQFALASGATLLVNADGTYSYNPNGKFDYLAGNGSGASNTSAIDSFTYTLANGGTATVQITVNGLTGAGDELRGSVGNDVVTGSALGEFFFLQAGGDDTALGGDGADAFYFGAALTAGDSANGGGGFDQLGIQGDYSAGLLLNSSNMVDVEFLVLMSGGDTRFGDPGINYYDYSVTTVDASVAAGQQFYVSANTLRVGEDLIFNGAAETDGTFFTYGGQGVDNITGGQLADSFYFGIDGRFGAGDVIDGQGGLDQLGLQGNYTVTFGAAQLSNVEVLVMLTASDARFASPGQAFSYDLTMNDGNVAAGQTMYVSANRLHAGEVLSFNGSAEMNGNFTVFSGSANDTIVGGAGNDLIFGAAGADTMSGGAGADVFAYTSETHSTSGARDAILDFTLGDIIDLSRIDAIAGSPGNDAFTAIGALGFSGAGGEVRYEQLAGNQWLVQADTDGISGADFELLITVSDGHIISAGDLIM